MHGWTVVWPSQKAEQNWVRVSSLPRSTGSRRNQILTCEMYHPSRYQTRKHTSRKRRYQNLWYGMGCPYDGIKNQSMWNTIVSVSWSDQRNSLWLKSGYLGGRSNYLWAYHEYDSIQDLVRRWSEKDCWRRSGLPKLCGCEQYGHRLHQASTV